MSKITRMTARSVLADRLLITTAPRRALAGSFSVLAVICVGAGGLLLPPPSPVAAQERTPPAEAPRAARAEARPEGAKAEGGRAEAAKPLEDKLVVTHHKVRIGGQEVAYTATAGTLVLREEDGKAKASLFFIAYTRDGVKDPARRPIAFTYNGGPGSSSVWLHLGAFGPRRVLMDDEGMPLAPPYRLVDNGESLLDVTDLVFIDPVSTGYSRPAQGEDPNQFHGLREDIKWVGEFIRLYTGRFARWSSPKFLVGESYGTTRSAGLSRYLQESHGMYLNGIVLISSILNFETARFDVGNDLPYPLFLPTYTATAWYHQRLPPDLQADLKKALAEAESFALGEYTLALARGNELPAAERRAVAARLARLTGLSPDYLERANLRPVISGFVKELLRDSRQTVGRIDSRYKGVDRTATGETYEYDPSSAATQGPFTAMLNDYVHSELGFASDLPYEILTDRVRPWNYKDFANQYVNVAEDLRRALAENASLKVFVANGYFDLATPFFATRYTFDHLGFDPTYPQRVSMAYYECGHMMYVRRADREKLKSDVAGFIAAASNGDAGKEKTAAR
jgi:carboxypeptidase C (cathepsin A)